MPASVPRNGRGRGGVRETDAEDLDDALHGCAAILAVMAGLGIPATRRALHRWTTNLPASRRPPVRHEREGNRLTLTASKKRLIAWVIRMDDEKYAGFTKIRARHVKASRTARGVLLGVGRSSSRRDDPAPAAVSR